MNAIIKSSLKRYANNKYSQLTSGYLFIMIY